MLEGFYQADTVLETERLLLRPMQEEDRSALFRNINNDREVLRYYLDRYLEKEEDLDLKPLIEWCQKAKRYCFAIVRKDSGEVIGMMNQCSGPDKYFRNVEVGYAIGRKYWDQGYVSEALPVFIDLLFRKGIHKVTASAMKENAASIRVMQKSGMTYECTKKEEVFYRDRYWDLEVFSVINDVSRETSH
ncbi:MAG: GNAT family N-acetyltransferase [Erysipelotrichaceae bacterium]|nr:GNAT family N-acetyltransferase [Erysipelotrichaceae bacterium]